MASPSIPAKTPEAAAASAGPVQSPWWLEYHFGHLLHKLAQWRPTWLAHIQKQRRRTLTHSDTFWVARESSHRVLGDVVPIVGVVRMNANGEPELVHHRCPWLEMPQIGIQPRPFPWVPRLGAHAQPDDQGEVARRQVCVLPKLWLVFVAAGAQLHQLHQRRRSSCICKEKVRRGRSKSKRAQWRHPPL